MTVALRSHAGVALMVTTVLASAVASIDANVIKVAIPAIGRDLHAGTAALQWSVTGYLVTVAALLLLAGALADRFGRRRLVGVGLGVMLVASVLCAIAPSIGTLIAARVVQGIGGALVLPNSLAPAMIVMAVLCGLAALVAAALSPVGRPRRVSLALPRERRRRSRGHGRWRRRPLSHHIPDRRHTTWKASVHSTDASPSSGAVRRSQPEAARPLQHLQPCAQPWGDATYGALA
jgi:O-antigen ligase